MKKYSILFGSLLATALAINAPQASAFGISSLTSAIPGVSGGAASSNVSAADIDVFIKTAQDADAMIASSTDYIFRALADKADIEKYEAGMAQARTIADPKEQQAAIDKIKDDEVTATQKQLASADIQQKLNGMSKEKLKAFGNAAFTYMLGVLKDKQLADGSRALVTGVAANPVLVGRLAALKDVVSSVSSQAVNTAKIGDGLVKIASAGKVITLPTSSSDKAKAVATF
ncbi:hypothetical protein VOM14_27575 [Paraburkholderia sp. MPAMCS5]|uniref:hypothetical protein n=1 Tax=Paraburkholderia sp. MPAMCS5 TaxID=3112563 RepID=UPI002E16F922|nr:hypothetical protein [Paraburkholderia sp. MPAMCS5]